jgi:amidase
LFLDVTTTLPAPDGGFVAAAARAPGRLRIALSTKAPPPLMARAGRPQRAAVAEAGALLRELGHDVVERDPDYPTAATVTNYLPRWARGVHDDLATMAHPELVETRTRNMARLGALLSDQRMAAVRAGEDAVAKRVLRIFDDVDVVLTPGAALGPSRIGAYQHRGAITTALLAGMRVPYQEVFNVTGQPAAVVPWGLDDDRVPLSVQLVGRPSDEATLLSLSGQIESARPWAQRRPPVS